MSWYQVFVLDAEGCTLCNTEESNLRLAKNSAREKLVERDLIDAGAHKVEVRNEEGVCLYDKFYPVKVEHVR
jgi:hypothetical protein